MASSVLHNFTIGQVPSSLLTLSPDGTKLYGNTWSGGVDNNGVVYSINVDGSGYTTLHFFGSISNDGTGPTGTLTLSNDGKTLYGTTLNGGLTNNGTIFSINTDGSNYQSIYSFNGTSGKTPYCGITLSSDGKFLYGTTTTDDVSGNGCVFSYDLSSNLYNYYVFTGTNSSRNPRSNLLLIGSTLYGTTQEGGDGSGNIYSINKNLTSYVSLYSFQNNGTDGTQPMGNIVLVNGDLYGTTNSGGTNSAGTIYVYYIASVMKVSYQKIYDFQGKKDGANPSGGISFSKNAVFYGTTNSNNGTIFSFTTLTANLNTLYKFSNKYANPEFSVTISNDGNILYGTTSEGTPTYGAIYEFNLNPSPPPPPPPKPTICFGEGTKILCLVNGKQKYIPIEEIEEGTLVKTYKDGYKAVVINARGKLYNTCDKTINKLYKLPMKTITNKKGSSELIEDLYVTGSHALLHDKLTQTQLESMAALSVYIEQNYHEMPAYHGMIHDKYKLIAYYNENFEEVNDNKVYNIYHLLLESDNMFTNYAIYANGILAESADEYSFIRFSNFEKINQKPNKEKRTKYLTSTKRLLNF